MVHSLFIIARKERKSDFGLRFSSVKSHCSKACCAISTVMKGIIGMAEADKPGKMCPPPCRSMWCWAERMRPSPSRTKAAARRQPNMIKSMVQKPQTLLNTESQQILSWFHLVSILEQYCTRSSIGTCTTSTTVEHLYLKGHKNIWLSSASQTVTAFGALMEPAWGPRAPSRRERCRQKSSLLLHRRTRVMETRQH